jgi:AcrR family transcriptional regulator
MYTRISGDHAWLSRPRKLPSQERSRLTVDALLEATTGVLTKEGHDKTSTNEIAAVARVSIGSLYQYVPSKEALMGAVADRHTREMLKVIRNSLIKVAARPIEVVARELVSGMINAPRVDPELNRVVEQIRRTGQLENIETIERELYALVRGYHDADRDEMMSPIRMSPLHLRDGSRGANACGGSALPGHPHRRQSTKVFGRRNSPCGPISTKTMI